MSNTNINTNANAMPANSASATDVFAAIITASFSYKKKVDGKMQVVSSTLKEDNFNHLPKASDLPDCAKSAYNALADAYEWHEKAMTTSDTTAANKSLQKSQNYLKKYLSAVDLETDALNMAALTETFGLKRQKSKGEYKASCTSKTTFIKYVLFLTNYFKNHGTWKAPAKSSSGKTVCTNIFSLDDFKDALISFGLDETTILKQIQQIKTARENAAAKVSA